MRCFLLICAFALLPASAASAMPVEGKVGYGEWAARFGNFRRGHVHAGQDVFARPGTFLHAIRDAVVVEVGEGDGRGNHIALYSAAERETYVYFHMLHPSFRRVGDRVAAGDRVGRLGCTGSCDGPHLHFEVRRGRGSYGNPRNPLPLLRSLQTASAQGVAD